MSLNALGLGFVFSATDLASGTMRRIKGAFTNLEQEGGQSIDRLDDSIARLGAGLAGLAIGVAGVKASFGLAEKAADLEYALMGVKTVSNATAHELTLLKDAAIKAGIETQFTPEEATQGLRELAQAGFNARESIKLLRPTLDLAASSGGHLSLADTAGLMSQSLKAFNIDSRLAGAAADQLATQANSSALRFEELPIAIGLATRGSSIMNQSITETLATLGLVRDVMPQVERGATGIGVSMERMVNPRVTKALEGIGVHVVDAQGHFRRFLDIVLDLTNAMSGMGELGSKAFLTETFGGHAVAPMTVLIDQLRYGVRSLGGLKGAEAIDALRNRLIDANDTTHKVSKDLLSTYKGQQILLHGSVETFKTMLGEPFKDALKPVVTFAITNLNKLIGVLQNLSPEAKTFAARGFVLTSVFVALSGALLLASAVFPLIKAGALLASGALWKMAAAGAGSLVPMLPWIIGAAAVAAIAYEIYKHFGIVTDAWHVLSGVFKDPALREFGSALADIGKYLLLVLGPIVGGYGITVGLNAGIPILIDALSALKVAFLEVGAAMLANPIGLILGLLAALALLVVAIDQNWLGLGDDFRTGALIVGEFFEDMLKKVEKFFTYLRDHSGMLKAFSYLLGPTIGGALRTTLTGVSLIGAKTKEPLVDTGAQTPGPSGGPGGEQGAAVSPLKQSVRESVAATQSAGGAQTAEYERAPMSRADANMSVGITDAQLDRLAKMINERPVIAHLEVDGERLASTVAGAQSSFGEQSAIPGSGFGE